MIWSGVMAGTLPTRAAPASGLCGTPSGALEQPTVPGLYGRRSGTRDEDAAWPAIPNGQTSSTARDARTPIRAKLFSKLSKEITVAAKMGDPDPDKNPRLRLAVKEAKSSSVPKDVIDRAIKKSMVGEGDEYEEIRYEGYGPNGVAVIVEAMTDNRNRTASNVRSTFTKNGGNLGETGSVGFMFERKGEVTYPAEAGDADTVMLAAIEAGAEDVESSEDGHVIWCADTDLNEVATALEASLGEVELDQAGLEAHHDHRA